jgi:phage gp16-like protein
MTATARKPAGDYRRALYAKISIALKDLGIEDESFRDILQLRYAKRSRTELTEVQLVDLVKHFESLGFRPKRTAPARAGSRPMADGAEAKKIRALWISGYHLGVIKDASETALGAFAKRVTGGKSGGVDALGWLDTPAAAKVIEALKDWLTREAGVCWDAYSRVKGAPVERSRARVLEAQWKIMAQLGLVDIDHSTALDRFAARRFRINRDISITHLAPAEQDVLIREFGERIRRAKT